MFVQNLILIHLVDANFYLTYKSFWGFLLYKTEFWRNIHPLWCECVLDIIWLMLSGSNFFSLFLEIKCPKTQIKHGFIVGAYNNKVYYTCNEGFKLLSNKWWGEAKCVGSVWVGLQQCIGNSYLMLNNLLCCLFPLL